MPETIGSHFRRVIKDLKTQDNNSNSCLNNPKATSTIQITTQQSNIDTFAVDKLNKF